MNGLPLTDRPTYYNIHQFMTKEDKKAYKKHIDECINRLQKTYFSTPEEGAKATDDQQLMDKVEKLRSPKNQIY